MEFSLGAPGPVAIEMHDARGRRVKTLLRETCPAGAGSVRLDTRGLASGVYFVRMVSAAQQTTRKITVVR